MGMKVANVDQYELTNCSYLFWMHKKLLPSIFIVSNICTLGFLHYKKNPWFCNVLLYIMSKWNSVDVASLYNRVQKYLSLLLFKLIVNDVKISCLTQLDPRNFTFLAFMNFAKRKNTREKKCDVWKRHYISSMWCLKPSLHTINVMSHPKELRKEALSIVHNHAFYYYYCPWKKMNYQIPPPKSLWSACPRKHSTGPI